MLELFEKDIDKVQCPLESPFMFLPNDVALNNIKQCVTMKDVSLFVTDQDVSFEDTM